MLKTAQEIGRHETAWPVAQQGYSVGAREELRARALREERQMGQRSLSRLLSIEDINDK